jgi:saccharopine dehydrogenase (NAD+, L-lysine-forming)
MLTHITKPLSNPSRPHWKERIPLTGRHKANQARATRPRRAFWQSGPTERPKFAASMNTTRYSHIGLIREGKQPPDKRVALTPAQCAEVVKRYPHVRLVVQRSAVRACTDAEYGAASVELVDDVSDCDLIIGIKEVPVDMLVPGRSHLFFSHTIKEQPHNRELLKAVLDKGVRLIDHELLTDPHGTRVLAFGYWAGVVGAYNAFRAWQLVHGGPELKPAHECHDLEELERHLHAYPLPQDLRIVITGGGRVGKGAMGVLERAGVERVSPATFLEERHNGPVYTVLGSSDLYARNDGRPFDKAAFHADPTGHRARFLPYARHAHIYMACHFWDARGPKILSADDLRDPHCRLQVVADISCDVNGPIDSTLRASTIDEPFYGYDPATGTERPAGTPGTITVMAVDNLPCELPRDASEAFGRDLIERVLPYLVGDDAEGMIERAMIARDGKLTERFSYLEAYAKG